MADDYCNQCGMNENHCRCPAVRPGWLDRQIQDAIGSQPHVLKAEIADLRAQLAARDAEVGRLRDLLSRYYHEVPLGHQPHMIAHLVEAVLKGEG